MTLFETSSNLVDKNIQSILFNDFIPFKDSRSVQQYEKS